MDHTKLEGLEDQKKKQDRYSIHSVEKSLDVIEILSLHDSLSLIELAELVNQPKSSLYRIILTLEKRGFISRSDEDGKYCLGMKQLVITKNLLERISLRTSALVEMNKLVDRYGDTVNLCKLSGQKVLYVAIIEGTHALRMSDTIGSLQPFHATATGKVMVAHLPEQDRLQLLEQATFESFTPNTLVEEAALIKEFDRIRLQGYALDDEEISQGARCIAAPIFNMYGQIEGAISLSGAIHRFSNDRIEAIAIEVIRASKQISFKLGYTEVQ